MRLEFHLDYRESVGLSIQHSSDVAGLERAVQILEALAPIIKQIIEEHNAKQVPPNA